MRFKELADEQWDLIKQMIPSPAKEGRPRANDMRTINAILYVLTTGCRWMDIPEKYGDDVTALRRLKRWEEQGVWGNLPDVITGHRCQSDEFIIDAVSIDSTDVAAKKGGS